MGNISKLKLGLIEKTIPILGFGTSTFSFISSETTKEAILHSIKLGYRHLNMTTIYQTKQIMVEPFPKLSPSDSSNLELSLLLLPNFHELKHTMILSCPPYEKYSSMILNMFIIFTFSPQNIGLVLVWSLNLRLCQFGTYFIYVFISILASRYVTPWTPGSDKSINLQSNNILLNFNNISQKMCKCDILI